MRNGALGSIGLALVLASAPQQIAASTTYELASSSNRQWGCHGPCACPEIQAPVAGSFVLVPRAPDPLYRNFDVVDIAWTLGPPAAPERWKGAGRYRVGGEFAVMHQLVLDLVDEAGHAHHYDSGTIPGGGDFPNLSIAAAAETVGCFHDVWQIDAHPASAGAPSNPAIGSIAATPNPFTAAIDIAFTITTESQVTAELVDLSGRRIHEDPPRDLPPGTHHIQWSSAAMDRLPPGLYTVVLRTPQAQTKTRIVHLQ